MQTDMVGQEGRETKLVRERPMDDHEVKMNAERPEKIKLPH